MMSVLCQCLVLHFYEWSTWIGGQITIWQKQKLSTSVYIAEFLVKEG